MDLAIQRLDFGAIQGALLRRIHTPLGEHEVHALAPLPDINAARERIEAINQARVLLELREPPPVWGAQDVRLALDLGEKGMVLEGVSLRAIADTARAGSMLRAHLLAHEHVAPLLYGLVTAYPDLGRLAGEISRCFDRDGQLADHASPALGPLRERVRNLRERTQAQLSELLHSPEMQPLLQEHYYTLRAERYVLPIKASFKNEVKGIVHDASGSGQTVYIEPQAIVDLGNRLKIAQSEQEEEERRILAMLTEMVAKEAAPIRAMLFVIGRIDLLTACARLAEDLDAVPVLPDATPGFSLVRAQHPLLLLQVVDSDHQSEDKRTAGASDVGLGVVERASAEKGTTSRRQRLKESRVVGNDFSLEAAQRILVLTGPNTGGKTVAMKTIGLFALMVRAGLHLPCKAGSRMGWFDDIQVAIGDQQSIASNLSTFAAHIQELTSILRRATQNSLVLIDEIASDTDPTQGQALAQATLERLASVGSFVIVTTHYERLKAVPFVDERFRNAGVGFDPVKMRPTYQVTLDVPQSSSGLDIAAALGIPLDIVERAKTLAGDGTNKIEELLRGLENRARELDDMIEGARKARSDAAEEGERLRFKERALQHEIERLQDRAQKELFSEIESARNRVRTIIARLQAAEEHSSARDAMRIANDAAVQLTGMLNVEEQKFERAVSTSSQGPLPSVTVGDWVHVLPLGRDADVVDVDGKEIHVAVGNMRMRVQLSDLRPAKSPRSKRQEKLRTPAPRPGSRPEAEEDKKEIFEEIDVRGHTVDEALARLDAFLDHHYGGAATHVRIIHGIGTFALRDAIRDHLRGSGYVKSMRPGVMNEGGDGVTVVALG